MVGLLGPRLKVGVVTLLAKVTQCNFAGVGFNSLLTSCRAMVQDMELWCKFCHGIQL